jgi:hypothetical protein
LLPFSENDQDQVEEIRNYLNKLIPLAADYEYDDMDAENIYKAIKRLRLGKDFYDRFGYIVFNYIFSDNIFKELDSRLILWE